MSQKTQGFTAVELLIAIVVGSLLFISAYQLYLNVTRQSSDAQWRSIASNVAYDILRTSQPASYGLVQNPCVAASLSGSNVTIPSYSQLSGATATVSATCPYSPAVPSLTLLTVQLNYTANGQSQTVYRAITSTAN